MERIGSTDAKTRFGEILRRAREGETFVITQNGQEAARLVPPVRARASRISVDEAIRTIRGLRPLEPLTRDEVKAFIDDGRRF